MKALWVGGLRQMSVEGGAVIVKFEVGVEGGGEVLLVYWNVILEGLGGDAGPWRLEVFNS